MSLRLPESKTQSWLDLHVVEQVLTGGTSDDLWARACELLQKGAGSKIVAGFSCDPQASAPILAVHPPEAQSAFESLIQDGFYEMIARTSSCGWLPEDALPQLAGNRARNLFLCPVEDGGTLIGKLLLLDVGELFSEPSVQVFAKLLALVNARQTRHLAEAIQGLSQSEARFQAIYESVSDAIFVQGLDSGPILDVNRRMCEMFGYSREELLKLDLGCLGVGLAPYTQEDAKAWTQKAAEGVPQSFEWLSKGKTGQLFWIEVNMRRASIGGEDQLLLTARDITDRKRGEVERAARLRRAEAQNNVSMALAGVGPNYQEALDLITRYLSAQIGDLCLLNLVDGDGMARPVALSQSYIDGNDLIPDVADLAPLPLENHGHGDVACEGRSIRMTDHTRDRIRALVRPELHGYLDHFNVHSLLIVPMRSEGKIIGTISMVKGSSSRPYTVEDQAMLQNLADRAGLTIANARLYGENLAQAEALRVANADLERRVEERTAELAKANALLRQLATEDGLTGLANRRHFKAVFDAEIRRAKRAKGRLAVILGDVDFFKRYNDHYGHLAGDSCLKTVGKVMREVFQRAGELPARYGGEEFVVVLPGLDAENAVRAAEKLRLSIEARNVPHASSDASDHVTLSLGVVSAVVTGETTADWFISRADEALYESKKNGRNRVTCL